MVAEADPNSLLGLWKQEDVGVDVRQALFGRAAIFALQPLETVLGVGPDIMVDAHDKPKLIPGVELLRQVFERVFGHTDKQPIDVRQIVQQPGNLLRVHAQDQAHPHDLSPLGLLLPAMLPEKVEDRLVLGKPRTPGQLLGPPPSKAVG